MGGTRDGEMHIIHVSTTQGSAPACPPQLADVHPQFRTHTCSVFGDSGFQRKSLNDELPSPRDQRGLAHS